MSMDRELITGDDWVDRGIDHLVIQAGLWQNRALDAEARLSRVPALLEALRKIGSLDWMRVSVGVNGEYTTTDWRDHYEVIALAQSTVADWEQE